MVTDEDAPSSRRPEPPPVIPGLIVNLEPPPPDLPPRQRWWLRRDVIEMFVVFVIAVLPPMLHAVSGYITADPQGEWSHDELGLYFWLIERSVLVSIPVLYIMWRSRLGWAFFGMGRKPRLLDALLGAGVLIVDHALYYAIYGVQLLAYFLTRGLDALQFPTIVATTPYYDGDAWSRAPLWIPLAILASLANGFAEELVMRAYFIPRLERATRSTLTAVIITSLAFGSYHVYQGIGAALFTVATGLILGFVFVKTRRLWPVFFAHMLMDLLPFLFWSGASAIPPI